MRVRVVRLVIRLRVMWLQSVLVRFLRRWVPLLSVLVRALLVVIRVMRSIRRRVCVDRFRCLLRVITVAWTPASGGRCEGFYCL